MMTKANSDGGLTVGSLTGKQAIKYAREGYKVLPLWGIDAKGVCACPAGSKETMLVNGKKVKHSKGKHPITKGGVKDATTDENTISRWYAKHPSANIGIVPKEGTIVIDIDPRNGGEPPDWLPEDGPHQFTGGNGDHYIIKGGPEIERSIKRWLKANEWKGIDVLNGNRYIVAAPSMHPDNAVVRAYRWEPHREYDTAPRRIVLSDSGENSEGKVQPKSLLDMPDGGLREETLGAHSQYSLTEMRKILSHVEDNTTYANWIRIGQALKHEYGNEGFELWAEWSGRDYDDFDEDICKGKWDSFSTKGKDEKQLVKIGTVVGQAKQGGWSSLRGRYDFVTDEITPSLVRTEPEPIEFVAAPLLVREKVSMLSAHGGTGKSFLALTVAMLAAEGRSFGELFEVEEPRRSLVLMAEDDIGDLHRRVHAICVAHKISPEIFGDMVSARSVYGADYRLRDGDSETDRVGEIIKLAKKREAELIVIDPMVRFHDSNENDNTEMANLMTTIEYIARESGAAVWLIHHMGKPSKGGESGGPSQHDSRGASSIATSVRSMAVMERIGIHHREFGLPTIEVGNKYAFVQVVKTNYSGAHGVEMVVHYGANGVPMIDDSIKRLSEEELSRMKKEAQENARAKGAETQHFKTTAKITMFRKLIEDGTIKVTEKERFDYGENRDEVIEKLGFNGYDSFKSWVSQNREFINQDSEISELIGTKGEGKGKFLKVSQ